MTDMQPHHDIPMVMPGVIVPPKRTRRGHKRAPMTGEPVVTALPDNAVSVSLFGSRAAGRSMTLDADVWDDVSRMTKRWVLNTNGRGLDYVRSGTRLSGSVARQPGDRPTATLARIILNARRREEVGYRNGNHLDLRRANLWLDHPQRAAKQSS